MGMTLLPCLLLLLTAELVLRYRRSSYIKRLTEKEQFWRGSIPIHRRSDNPELIYELVPGSSAVREGVEIRINSDGFRDDEFPREISPATPRIVVLGDSVAWGYGVPLEEAFPQLLEEDLIRATPEGGEAPVVYNLAVDGYSTSQEISLLETRGPALRPDLVIISYHLNDPDTMGGGLARHYTNRPRFEILHRARQAIGRLKEILGKIESPAAWLEENDYHRRIHARYQKEVREQFRHIGRISRERGVPVLVAVMPVFDFRPGEKYGWWDLHERIGELCRENGLGFLDLCDSFKDFSSAEVSSSVWHPNARGHRIMAGALADYLDSGSWRKALRSATAE